MKKFKNEGIPLDVRLRFQIETIDKSFPFIIE